MGYVFVFMTIGLTIYGQLIIKWQVDKAGAMPEASAEKLWFLAGLVLNPWVLSGFAAAFLASVAWMAALTKLPLSVAYPFTSLTFVSVMLLSAVLFHEALTPPRLAGIALIMLGLVVGSQKW